VELKKSSIIIDGLKKKLEAKNQEIGILKAKIHLDMVEMSIKVVAEYPDLVEENNELYAVVD
jgi:hypothetical protein